MAPGAEGKQPIVDKKELDRYHKCVWIFLKRLKEINPTHAPITAIDSILTDMGIIRENSLNFSDLDVKVLIDNKYKPDSTSIENSTNRKLLFVEKYRLDTGKITIEDFINVYDIVSSPNLYSEIKKSLKFLAGIERLSSSPERLKDISLTIAQILVTLTEDERDLFGQAIMGNAEIGPFWTMMIKGYSGEYDGDSEKDKKIRHQVPIYENFVRCLIG